MTESPHPSASTAMWRAAALASIVAVGASACPVGEAGSAAWTGMLDTLPLGAVVVRNPAIGLWDSSTAWRIEEVTRIGQVEGDGADVFARIASLVVDRLGRIYVLESQAQEIRVFEPDGRHVRTFGRKGGGPREFLDARGMAWDAEGRLWVVDQRNATYSIWDTAGAFLTSYRRPGTSAYRNWIGGFDSTGRFYDVGTVFERAVSEPGKTMGSGARTVLFEVDRDGAVTDTVSVPTYDMQTFEGTFGTGRSISRVNIPVPFTGQLQWDFDPRGYIVSAITDTYRVVFQTLSGDTIRLVERAYTPVPVTQEDRDRARERWSRSPVLARMLDPSRFGSHHPPIVSFSVASTGHLWVRAFRAPSETTGGTVFDVFDPEGRFLGPARADFNVGSPLVFVGEYLYAVTRDDLGVPYVVRARIAKPG